MAGLATFTFLVGPGHWQGNDACPVKRPRLASGERQVLRNLLKVSLFLVNAFSATAPTTEHEIIYAFLNQGAVPSACGKTWPPARHRAPPHWKTRGHRSGGRRGQ